MKIIQKAKAKAKEPTNMKFKKKMSKIPRIPLKFPQLSLPNNHRKKKSLNNRNNLSNNNNSNKNL